MEKIAVNLDGGRSCPIFTGTKLSEAGALAKQELNGAGKALIITNSKVGPLYSSLLKNSLENAGFSVSVAQIPDGEQHKNLETVKKLYEKCVSEKIERNSCIFALGGGVVGDIAGFVAATYLRGTKLVQVPTTLLAQVDSSIGGKTGVNLKGGKNLVGSFYQPDAVIICSEVLRTLPKRELSCGISEVIKYGCIADAKLFSYLKDNVEKIISLDRASIDKIITVSCSIKAQIVSRDEREKKGERMLLNFGHTIGHAIETVTSYKKYKHGEAIAIGMVAASIISEKTGLMRKSDAVRIKNLITAYSLPSACPKIPVSSLLDAMKVDKKVSKGKINFVLLEGIGKAKVSNAVPKKTISGALGEICA